MLFPALGMTAAMWLLMGPLMELEMGARAVLTVGVGGFALLLSVLSFRYRSAGWGVAALGFLLGVANLFMFGSIAACASLATCAVALVAAGAAPQPVLVAANAAAVAPQVPAMPATGEHREMPIAA
jgi:hypothetical protein